MTLSDELDKLAELHRSAELSDAEFELAKQRLLNPASTIPPSSHHQVAALTEKLRNLEIDLEIMRLDASWQIELEQYVFHNGPGQRYVPSITEGQMIAGAAALGMFAAMLSAVLFREPGVMVLILPLGIPFIMGCYWIRKTMRYNAAERVYLAKRSELLNRKTNGAIRSVPDPIKLKIGKSG